MDHAQNDILISAYLDGELTAEERNHVEQLLASDAEARQLFEELRSLRASLATLPQHRLEPGFANDIVRLATQQLQADASPAKAAILPHGDRQVDAARSIWSTWRGITWAAVALAAALLILVTNYGKNENGRQVALQPMISDKASEISSLAEGQQLEQSAPIQDSVPLEKETATPTISARSSKTQSKFGGGLGGGGFGEDSLQSRPESMSREFLSGSKANASQADRYSAPTSTLRREPSSDDVLVVRIDLTRDATKSKAFEDILSQNKIAIRNSDREQSDDSGLNKAFTDGKQSGYESQSLGIVVVEASAEQLAAVLNKLKASPDMFRSVAVAEPTSSSQSSEIALPQAAALSAPAASGPAVANSPAPSSADRSSREQRDAEEAKMMEMSSQPVVPPPSSLSSPLAAPARPFGEPASGSIRSSGEEKGLRTDEKQPQGGHKPVKAVFVLRIIDAAPAMGVEK